MTHAGLLPFWKNRNKALDGTDAIARMQGGEDEVACFSGGDGGSDRFNLADFADKNHIGILTERLNQSRIERRGVTPNLALMDEALVGLVSILDRIFDGNDVPIARAVNQVDERRQRRAFARACRTGDDDAVSFVDVDFDDAYSWKGFEFRTVSTVPVGMPPAD